MHEELEAALRRNLAQQKALQERLCQALSTSAVRQQHITDQQRLLAELYRELEQLIQEMRRLKGPQAGQLKHPRQLS